MAVLEECIQMKNNPIRGFEETLIILTLGILLLVSFSDFYIAFFSNPFPGEMELYRKIGQGLAVIRSILSTWPCFIAGLLCGLIFSRRAMLYAMFVMTPTASLLAISFTDGHLLNASSNLLFAFVFTWLGAQLGLNVKHAYRVPSAYMPNNTTAFRLILRGLASLAVAALTIAVAAILHNVLIGRIKSETIPALTFFFAFLIAALYLRFAIRIQIVAHTDANTSFERETAERLPITLR